jgi:hypothetical protein
MIRKREDDHMSKGPEEVFLKDEKPFNYRTLSGFEFNEVYTCASVMPRNEFPAEHPFTQGIYSDMYGGRFWGIGWLNLQRLLLNPFGHHGNR